MAGQATTNTTQPTAPRDRALWRGIVPDAIGIALAGVILVVVIGLTLAADRMLAGNRSTARAATAQAQAEAAAAIIGEAQRVGATPSPAQLSRLHEAAPLSLVRVQDAAGNVVYDWRPGKGTGSAAGAGVPARAATTARAPVALSDGQMGTVELHLRDDGATATRVLLALAGSVAGVVALGAYLLLYRHLRRHVRAMEAIQQNLRAYAGGIETQLMTLTLGNALGEDARCWNHLLGQMQELERQLELREVASSSGDVATAALSRFENRTLRAVLDHLPVGILRFDATQRVSYANAAAARLVGRPLDEVLSRPLNELIGEECAQPLAGACAHRSKTHVIDRRLGSGDDAPSVRLQVFPSPGVEDEGLLMLQDISHLVEAERARDQFLYHVTHELRTPLTNIHAYAETLSQPDFDDEQTRKECYNVIISETQRLSALVEDILSLSQLEVGSLRVEWSDIDLARLLRGMVQDNLGKADEKSIELTLKLAPKIPRLRGDKNRLAVLLNNLIGNAIKYTPEGGRVDVTLEAGEHWVQVGVADTGIGIVATDQAKVFDKFYRADNEHVRQIKGTGLGLAIAREVARMHGGDIHLQSEPGIGSTFTVELPVNADKGK